MARAPTVRVLVTTADRVVFDGSARSVVLPGEQGTFEVQPLHRPLMSRLLSGTIFIDRQGVPIRRGIMRVELDVLTAVVELP